MRRQVFGLGRQADAPRQLVSTPRLDPNRLASGLAQRAGISSDVYPVKAVWSCRLLVSASSSIKASRKNFAAQLRYRNLP